MDRNYFLLNKRQDYKDGSSQGLAYDDTGIWLDGKTGRDYGVFISKLYDSHEKGTNWSHIRIDRDLEDKTSLRVSIYAAERDSFEVNGRVVKISRILASEKLTCRDKLKWMKPYFVKSVTDASEALLYDVKARYLWLVVELFCTGERMSKINSIMLCFPKRTWLNYLPEVYQMESNHPSFLERFLSIFQLLYDDMDQKILNGARDYDPDAADEECLAFLAGWLGVEGTYIWSKEKLRWLLKHAANHYKVRGTVRGVEELLGLYLGEKPYVVEYHKLEEFKKNEGQRRLLSKLYGDDPYCFTVLVKENGVWSHKEHKTILTILNDVKPAYMEARVVVIRPYIFLDAYSYLGMNSVLGSYRPLALDELSVIPLTVVGNDENGLEALNEES